MRCSRWQQFSSLFSPICKAWKAGKSSPESSRLFLQVPRAGHHGASLTDGETEAQVVPTLLKATRSVGSRAVPLSALPELCSTGSSGFRGKLRCSYRRGSSRASNSQGVVTERRAGATLGPRSVPGPAAPLVGPLPLDPGLCVCRESQAGSSGPKMAHLAKWLWRPPFPFLLAPSCVNWLCFPVTRLSAGSLRGFCGAAGHWFQSALMPDY